MISAEQSSGIGEDQRADGLLGFGLDLTAGSSFKNARGRGCAGGCNERALRRYRDRRDRGIGKAPFSEGAPSGRIPGPHHAVVSRTKQLPGIVQVNQSPDWSMAAFPAASQPLGSRVE